MIYRAIVKRRARGVFAALSRGDWQATTAEVADDVHHAFPGDTRWAASGIRGRRSSAGSNGSTG
jgi:ketosteroid isomerase-like protein